MGKRFCVLATVGLLIGCYSTVLGCHSGPGTPIGNNQCRHACSRRQSRQETVYTYYRYYTSCGFLGWDRCGRTGRRTHYRQVYYTQNYYETRCCSGYVRHGGYCKRAVLGFEKSLTYLEKDGCTMSICAKVYLNDIVSSYDSLVHVLQYQVTLANGSVIKNGTIALSSIVRRNCFNLDISNHYRMQGDLSIVLSKLSSANYVVLNPHCAIIRPRKDVSIGFEETEMEVYENAGRIQICVAILKPANLNKIENVNFRILKYTRNVSGSHNLDFGSLYKYISLSKNNRRECSYINIVSDHIHEEDEEFEVVLKGSGLPDYATITSDIAKVTIINAKRNFTIGFTITDLEVIESAGSVTICLYSSVDNFQNGEVTFKVVIPMIHKNDLSMADPVIQFSGRSTSQCLSLHITDDSDIEGTETVTLMLDMVSTTQPFYMDVNPSFMKIKIIDDDSITIGFNSSVVEVEKGVPGQICALIHAGSNRISSPINFLLTYEDGTAIQGVHYYPVGGFFSSQYPVNCFAIFSLQFVSTNRQIRTFFMRLSNSPYFPRYENVILSPQSVLIKIKEKGRSSCSSGTYHCETGCSGSTNWTKSSDKTMSVSKDVCNSGDSIIKSRITSSTCPSTGQFCVESIEEKLIRSFQLGISHQVYNPEADSNSCNIKSERLTCANNPVPTSDECLSTRPSTCQSRSTLIVLDTSSSIGPQNFKLMTEAVANLTQHLCGNIRLAVAKFNQHAYLDRCFNCPTKSRFDLSRFIRNNVAFENTGSSGKNFDNAVCINRRVFSNECYNISQATDCVDIIYVTDGGISNSSCGQVKAWLSSQSSICSRSKIFALGIGKKVTNAELECIASSETEDIQTTFQFVDFIDFQKYVTKSIQLLYKQNKNCLSEKNLCEKNRIDLACRD